MDVRAELVYVLQSREASNVGSSTWKALPVSATMSKATSLEDSLRTQADVLVSCDGAEVVERPISTAVSGGCGRRVTYRQR